MTHLQYLHARLDEMCARVSREAAAKADRILIDMDTHDELPLRDQWKSGKTHYYYSRWETRRVIFPRLIAELEALVEGGPGRAV